MSRQASQHHLPRSKRYKNTYTVIMGKSNKKTPSEKQLASKRDIVPKKQVTDDNQNHAHFLFGITAMPRIVILPAGCKFASGW
jgi:hypothetical protein